MKMADSVKVVNAALDETPQGEIVLRGIIDPGSLKNLKVAEYQREILSAVKIRHLKEGLREGGVPDIVLGMRGQTVLEREGAFYLQDDTFIVDGLQRTTAALELLAEEGNEVVPHLGATIHFDTTDKTERVMFQKLNLGQTNLSNNVTLRNMQDEVPAVQALFRLTCNKGFVLFNQVSWNQSMRRGDLITAITYVKVAGMLHSHAGPGRSNDALGMARGADKIMANVGRGTFVGNVKTFFDVLDQCWGVRRVAYRQSAPYLRTTFLLELARIFSDHTNFWEGEHLKLDPTTLKKLAQFPIDDPEVARLASASGTAGEILNHMLVKHINNGRRTRRLQQRRTRHDQLTGEDMGQDDS